MAPMRRGSDPDLKIQLRLSYAWGEDPQRLQPTHHWPVLSSCLSLTARKGVNVDIHVRTHPSHLDEWVDLLVSGFERLQLDVMD